MLVMLSRRRGSLTFQNSGLPPLMTVTTFPPALPLPYWVRMSSRLWTCSEMASLLFASVVSVPSMKSRRSAFTSAILKLRFCMGVGIFSRKVASLPSSVMAALVISRMTLLRTPAFTIRTMLVMMLSTGWMKSRPLPCALRMGLSWFAKPRLAPRPRLSSETKRLNGT